MSDGYHRTRLIILKYPIIPAERLIQVVGRLSNPHLLNSVANEIRLNDNYLEVPLNIPMESPDESIIAYIKQIQEQVEQSIIWKNGNVENGNARLKQEIRAYIEEKKAIIRKDTDLMERLFTKLPIILERKQSNESTIDLSVKKQIQIIMPQPKPFEEFWLDRSKVIEIINFMQGACQWFERAPSAFNKLGEEDFRDILCSGLNMIFKNNLTGETFSKKGKADIHLLIPNGEILLAECKLWKGEKYYTEGIDQLFGYLTWKMNFGLFITFSGIKGFGDVVTKAKEITVHHSSYINNSLKDIGPKYFTTFHRFLADEKKQVEIHHCLFNINAE